MSAFFPTNRSLGRKKNRFSRRFVLVQKGVSMWMLRNEYLFKEVAICTNFWAIYSKI